MLLIVDFGLGNLTSIQNMLKRIDVNSTISSDPAALAHASKLIIPGVGSFDFGMKQLQERGLSEVLTRRVIGDEVPVLGICLGMQMFMQSSEEGILKGLSWLEGKVVRFSSGKIGELKIPHMGWAGIQVQKTSRLFAGMYDDPRFYFVHSYHVVSDDPGHVICTATHGYEFVAGVEKGNIVGIQFHPEKSHKYGMKILRNFVDNY